MSSDDRIGWVDKQVSKAMEFHIYPEKRAAAMEIWIIISAIVIIATIVFTDWIIFPAFVFVNALFIVYQRFKLENELEAIEKYKQEE